VSFSLPPLISNNSGAPGLRCYALYLSNQRLSFQNRFETFMPRHIVSFQVRFIDLAMSLRPRRFLRRRRRFWSRIIFLLIAGGIIAALAVHDPETRSKAGLHRLLTFSQG
jgi:hypothetical protein